MKAHKILDAGSKHIKDRAESRDQACGERTMGAIVKAFNIIYDKDLTEEQGWQFMVLLKMVRGANGKVNLDDYEDEAAYAALAGEAATNLREIVYELPSGKPIGSVIKARSPMLDKSPLATVYVLNEGEEWLSLQGTLIHYTKRCLEDQLYQKRGPSLPFDIKFHAIKFEDGMIWDRMNGWWS